MINTGRILVAVFSFVLIFFSHTPISLADTAIQAQPWIRAAIVTNATSISVSSNGPCHINRLMTTETIQSYDSAHTFSFDLAGGQIRLNGAGGSTTDGFSIILENASDLLSCNGRSYRRIIRVQAWEGKLICINVLPIEEYLWGVVPSEVPSSWATEALRAQAVAARTYTLRALSQYPDRPFDVYSTVVDQVYRGAGCETESTTKACLDTSGIVCTFNGLPIIAYYHAASGGWTASGEEMFGRNLPYLRAVPSRDSTIHRWTWRISTGSLSTALRNYGFPIGNIQRVFVHRFSSEGRASEIKIVHSNGVLLVSGSDLRRALGPANLESTYFTVEGQDAPEIPEESTNDNYSHIPMSEPIESISLVNPEIYIPFPVATPVERCTVISSDGSSSTEIIHVLSASDLTVYQSGYIWIAEPLRVYELTLNTIGGEFSFSVNTPEDLAAGCNIEGEIIDDPGAGVGNPSNGSIVFIGHGSGHGVGMSQHGARILAENDWTYNQILRYFYTGVEISRLW
jgi:stage II sporulation protein D